MKSIVQHLLILTIGFSTLVAQEKKQADPKPGDSIESRLAQYTTVRLTTDLSALTEKERRMIPILIDAAKQADEIFWLQSYGDKEALLSSISDPSVRKYAEINYGPWDRLRGDEPFVEGVGEKPKGANFYPLEMTKEEFEKAVSTSEERAKEFKSNYTLIRRDAKGGLVAVPYHKAYVERVEAMAEDLKKASELAEDPGLRRYLTLRSQALLTDNYQPSEIAWLEMKNNTIDIVIGPIETYEDKLFGYKASYEAYVLVKDKDWSARLARYADFLPVLQKGLPVPEVYKQEMPGADSDLNAYDVIYYAGDCNAGSKTIAINLPNDEEVQLKKGTRRLQLKNSVRAKFDKILIPIAQVLVAKDQQQHITFDAFFGNTMFHEVAHGLGIKNTINGRGTVRAALKEEAAWLEEGKADVLGLYMVTKLHEKGELKSESLEDNFTTFLASIFRSIRFGSSSAHGRANLVRFNFFKKMGAFSRDEATGTYRIDFEKMRQAMSALSEKILRFQGDGDYEGVKAFMAEMGKMDPLLERDLARLRTAGIPVDVVFEQGISVLGLR